MGQFYTGKISVGGKGKHRLGLRGEDAKGVYTAGEFLEKVAAKHNFRVKGEALVVGNGDIAFQAARAALERGSEKATIVCREADNEMTASAEEIARGEEAGVRVIHGWEPTSFPVHRDGATSGAHFKHCDRVYDADGRYAPVYDMRNTMSQYCDTLILVV